MPYVAHSSPRGKAWLSAQGRTCAVYASRPQLFLRHSSLTFLCVFRSMAAYRVSSEINNSAVNGFLRMTKRSTNQVIIKTTCCPIKIEIMTYVSAKIMELMYT